MNLLVCNDTPRTVNGSLQCDDWSVVNTNDIQTVDMSELIALLSFDFNVFSALMGTCIVLFIIGYSAGHVARQMGRV